MPKPVESRPHPVQAPRPRREPRRSLLKPLAVGGAVAGLLAASFVVPPLFEDGAPGSAAPAAEYGSAAMEHETAPPVAVGEGPKLGSVIPFAKHDVVTGEPISSETLAGRKTLLFFSEGVMCQACFVQIRDLEAVTEELAKRDIELVSITPDPPEVLSEAVGYYRIRTPMIADDDRTMSAAFNTLGKGMHADTPGHAFALLDEDGKVVWYRDYWLEPYRTMYVEPSRILADLPPA
jgi:peroxiredoxin